ncbi:MAG: hypothetical protein L6Q99_12655 [Planctomycetes bacterium]|nr:hypothetical protein [Planctomycetota bacterium]
MKRLVLVVIAGAIAWVLYLVLSSSRDERAKLETAGEPTNSRPTEEILADTDAGAAASARNAASTLATTPTRATELVIQVVDGRTQAPLGGAHVFVEREDVDEEAFEAATVRFGDAASRLGPALGREIVADSAGRVRVVSPSRALTIWATANGLAGEVRVGAGATDALVELVLDRGVTIEVLDSRGAPAANVEIALLEFELGSWTDVETLTTDERGRVEFQELGYHSPDEQGRLRAASALAACIPEFLEFDVDEPPTSPLRLQLEATGSVELQVTDARGEPLAVPTKLSLELDERMPDPLPFGLASRATLVAWSDDGRARFEGVGLGLELAARARTDGLEFTDRLVPGPTTAGELVTIQIPIVRAEPRVRGRLMTADGAPLSARVRLSVLQIEGREWTLADSLAIDASGEFQIYLPWYSAQAPQLRELRVDTREPGATPLRGRASWPARHTVQDIAPRDEYDVGDVVCEADPFLCSGRVAFPDGSPAPLAEVAAVWLDAAGQIAGRAYGLANEAAQFALGAPSEFDRFEVAASAANDSHWTRRQPVARGATDVVITLPNPRDSSALLGELIWPEGLTTDDIDFALDPADGSSRVWANWDENASGPFEITTVPLALATLVVLFQDEEIARLEGIELLAGETTEIASIDLRERVHSFRFELVDEDGRPLGAGNVCEIRGEEYVHHVDANALGIAVLPSLSTNIDVVASAPGCSSRIFKGVTSGGKLALPLGRRIVVRGPSLGAAGADLALAVELTYCGDDLAGVFSDDVALVFTQIDRAEATVSHLGQYCLRGALLVHRTSGARFALELDDSPWVTLVEAPEESLVTLPADALARALADATRR